MSDWFIPKRQMRTHTHLNVEEKIAYSEIQYENSSSATASSVVVVVAIKTVFSNGICFYRHVHANQPYSCTYE